VYGFAIDSCGELGYSLFAPKVRKVFENSANSIQRSAKAVVGQFDIKIHRYAMNVCLKARDSRTNR